jgi:hypothetical protein
MKIEEVKGNNDLEVKKIDFVCDGGLHDKLNNYDFTKQLNKHSFTYIVAPPSSGKSNLIQNLFKNQKMLKKCFHHIMYVCPSSSSLKDDIFNKLPENQRFMELNEETLGTIRNMCENYNKEEKSCIVLDDVACSLKNKELLKDFQRLIFNRRHIGGGVSVIVISQVYNVLPLQLRKMVNNLIILNPRMKEFNLMNDEYFNLDQKNVKKIKDFFFDKKYNFLMYCPDDNMYFKNFNKVIIDEDYTDDGE